ncbi:hypothetical protein ACFLUU_01975 [Chloroflexota bacterium]
MEEAGKLGQIIVWPDPNTIIIHISGEEILASREMNINTELLNICRRGESIEPARFWVSSRVNESLVIDGVAPQVFTFPNKEVYYKPKTLLSAMWLMFMWEIIGKTRVFECPSCGLWAEQLDRRQHYCSNACKQKKYRERLKQKNYIGGKK